MSLSKLHELMKNMEAWHAAVHGVVESPIGLREGTTKLARLIVIMVMVTTNKLHLHDMSIKVLSIPTMFYMLLSIGSEGDLKIAVKRRKAKSKGEKERYTHLNAEFHGIARGAKKAFLKNQCKEIEENNRTGKTRDLFKKIRDTKGMFHAKMGSIKDRNGRDITEAEDIKNRWQEYTEQLYKKDLHNPDNHDGVSTHLEPDILECEDKWALGSITTNKASGGDGIPVKLFQILKDDTVKVLH